VKDDVSRVPKRYIVLITNTYLSVKLSISYPVTTDYDKFSIYSDLFSFYISSINQYLEVATIYLIQRIHIILVVKTNNPIDLCKHDIRYSCSLFSP